MSLKTTLLGVVFFCGYSLWTKPETWATIPLSAGAREWIGFGVVLVTGHYLVKRIATVIDAVIDAKIDAKIDDHERSQHSKASKET